MKEAIGGTWLFVLTITFIALFTTFVSVTTNYSRCYKIKDEIITIIERKRGVNNVLYNPTTGDSTAEGSTIDTINDYLKSIGYASTGKCPSDSNCWLGFNMWNDNLNPVSYGDNINYCIAKHAIVYEVETMNDSGELVESGVLNGALGHPRQAYYEVVVFFKLDWPILRTFFNIRIDGETSIVFLNNDLDEFKQCYN